MKVGFIGIGNMGKHMSRRVQQAGYDLVVYDLIKEAARHLLDKGAIWRNTPREVAELCKIVLSCLPGPVDVEKVVYGSDGLLAGWKRGDIYVDMSTNSPSTIRRIAEDARAGGVAVLDAPVSGGVPGAEGGTLTIMVGGAPNSLESVRKVLETMGSRIFHVGDVGCGNIAKLVNNLISLTCNAITSEGFVLGVKAGIDTKKLWEVVTASTGNNWCVQQYPKAVFKGNFKPGFKLNLASKDIGLAMSLGREYGVPLPVGAAVEQSLLEAKAVGFGEKAVESTLQWLEEMVGIQVRTSE